MATTTSRNIYTGAACGCRKGVERDNCPRCEGSGRCLDFAAMRAQRTQAKASKPAFNPWVPPTLDIDKQLFDGRYMPPHCKVERRIVWNLLTGLEAAGFHVLAVNDGDGEDKTATIIEAMELVFNLDDCWVFVKKGHYGNHAIRLVLGNGVDCVSDWSFHKDDNDGFNAWMEGFKPETWE